MLDFTVCEMNGQPAAGKGTVKGAPSPCTFGFAQSGYRPCWSVAPSGPKGWLDGMKPPKRPRLTLQADDLENDQLRTKRLWPRGLQASPAAIPAVRAALGRFPAQLCHAAGGAYRTGVTIAP